MNLRDSPIEIPPCPLCGKIPYWEDSADDPPWYRIGCDTCEYYMITKDGKFETVYKRWLVWSKFKVFECDREDRAL